jgi:hypothetical protein
MQSLVCHPDFLEGKISQNDQKVLRDLMLTREGGDLLCRSIRFLEELASAVARFLAALDPTTNAIEHVLSLVCMLKRMRQIVLYETAARGPYAPLVDGRWGAPPLRALLRNCAKQCFLTVVPKRDGGGFVCAYSWSAGSKQRGQTWMRDASSLKQSYQEELFKTWAYETGEYSLASRKSADIRACWVLQNAEARRLQIAAGQIEMVLRRLSIHTAWRDLIADIAAVARPSPRAWRPGPIPWIYITALDEMIAKLQLGCRQLQARARRTVPQRAAEGPWPSQPLPKPKAERERQTAEERKTQPAADRTEAEQPRQDSAATGTSGPLVIEDSAIPSSPEEALQGLCGATTDGDESSESEDVPRVLPEQEPDAGPWPSTPERRPPCSDLEEGPACTDTCPEQTKPSTHRAADGIDAAEVEDERRVDADPAPEAGAAPRTSRDVVIERLAEWHGIAEGQINYRPMSSRQLQHTLGWKQAKVRKVMIKIFGKRPFTVYREMCAERTIGDCLLELSKGRTEMCESLAEGHRPNANE